MEYLSPLWELARARAAFLAFGYNGCNVENLSLVILVVLAKREGIVCFPLTSMFPIYNSVHCQGVIPGLYAMVGAAAALSGVTVCSSSISPIRFE